VRRRPFARGTDRRRLGRQQRLPGQYGLVDNQIARGHDAQVRRHDVAGLQHDEVAGNHIRQWNFAIQSAGRRHPRGAAR